MSIYAESSGSFDKTENFLKGMLQPNLYSFLDKFGKQGVDALRAATPVDSSVTANAWTYEIVKDKKSHSIIWNNTNVVDGTPVVILLQNGHGTRNGGYVVGKDFINPALKPVFDAIEREFSAVVSRLLNDRGNSLNVSWDVPTEIETTYKFKIGVATQGVGTSRLETTTGESRYPMTFKARNH